MINPCCIECGEVSRLVDGRTIYPHRPDLYHKWFYLCRCGAYCGCHGETKDSLGYPCNGVTRRARSAAHAAFDPLWQRNGLNKMSRREAYAWLAGALEIDPEQCHIGMMDLETATKVPALVAERLKERTTA